MKQKDRPRLVALNLDIKWPYKRHTGIFAGIHRYANEQGWETIIDEFVNHSLDHRRRGADRYDGVITRATTPLAERLERLKIPAVNVWFSSPATDILPGVFADYGASGSMRAEHFLDRGFRKFAAMIRRGRASKMEFEEYLRVIQEAGCSCSPLKVPDDISRTESLWEKTDKAIDDWMDEWEFPIGVHVSSEFMGRIVAQKCMERGWRVPEDVGIIAGRNEESICVQPQPSLSSVEMGYEKVGYESARLLNRLMEGRSEAGKDRNLPRHTFMQPRGLIVRESTDFYSVEDKLVASALAFISANSHESIGQDDVSRAVSTETRSLQNRFRKVLDRPIASVIRQVRIDRAKRQLSQGNRSMTSIATETGFSSPERLNEVFRRELGMSPTEYRKRHQMKKGVI